MDLTNSADPGKAESLGGRHLKCSCRYQLAYEAEKLSELRRQVASQEERFASLKRHLETLDSCASDTTAAVDAHSIAVESLVSIKERDLAVALMRVAELTRQLEQLCQGHLDGVLVDSTSSHAQLLDCRPELLQSIVRPLKSAHQSSAIERSRSVADVLLQSGKKESSGSDNGEVLSHSDRVSSLSLALSRMTKKPDESSSSLADTVAEIGPCSKPESDAEVRRLNKADTKIAVDMNENVIGIGQPQPHSHSHSVAVSEKLTLRFANPSSDSSQPSASGSDVNLSKDVPRGENTRASEAAAMDLTASSRADVGSGMRSTSPTRPSAVQLGKPSVAGSDSDPSRSSSLRENTPGSEADTADLFAGKTALIFVRPATESKQASAHASDLSPPKETTSEPEAAIGGVDSVPLHTRSWVSSASYTRKLGTRAASRYQSIASRLYGDSWLSSIGSANRNSAPNTSQSASSAAAFEGRSPEDAEQKTTMADSSDGADFQRSASPDLVHSCSSSTSSLVERPSLTSGSDDRGDDDVVAKECSGSDSSEGDDDSDDGGEPDGLVRLGPNSPHNDSLLKKDVVRWRQRLAASPPPRRVAHFPRLVDDADKEPSSPGSGVGRAGSISLSESSDVELAELTRSPESSKHVSFDPFTLSLNAALEGELDVLQSLFSQVDNINQSNDDGLTVLHNGVCSGSQDVLAFLIHAGCDVNVADCDGWTPLHCAASSNNVDAVRLLIEHGAGVLSFTWDSESETPLDKCRPDGSSFDECCQLITEAMSMLGVANGGLVYAIADYTANTTDEISFSAGDQLTVIQKGDKQETRWWWAKHRDGDTGYIPQNLVTLYPPTGCKNLAAKSLIETSC